MVGLLDIAPSTETVKIGDQEVEVYGVSAEGIAVLLGRFPDLRKALVGMEIDRATLVNESPELLAAIIAAGVGEPGNQKAEETARKLPVGLQAEILEKVIALTMPGGAGPFVERLERLAESIGGVRSATGRGMKSPKQSKHS